MKEEAVITSTLPIANQRRFNAAALLRQTVESAKSLAWMLSGFAILLAFWAMVSTFSEGALPGPIATLKVMGKLLSDPFYDNGPNDKGIGIQLGSSLLRVFAGFGLGTLVAIPAGVLIGASETCKKLFYPLVQLLKPVSPLAWFPIGLAVFKHAGEATIFVIFITSLWPTLINTAFGVASVPDDHRNVARAFAFSRRKYLTKILLPFSLPHILTGLRLSIGVAWLVIVAGEMLSGGIGIGFFVWDSWNALSLERVMSAILLIGIVGLLLDRGFDFIARRFSYA
jgi:nitrate/nitrite transport system permease protein